MTHTQTVHIWNQMCVMCCNYYAFTTRLNNYNELIQRTVMVNFIACLKITKITKLKSLFGTSGNGPFTTKVILDEWKKTFWIEFVQKLPFFFSSITVLHCVNKQRKGQTVIVVSLSFFFLFRVIWMCKMCKLHICCCCLF